MSPRSERRTRTRSVPSSDLWDRALGAGDPTSSNRAAGKQNARWASVDLSGGGSVAGTVLEYDLGHDLGETPTVVTLKRYERANGPVTITARGVRQEGWSHSHAFVEVTLHAGSLDGCRATFLVEGR